MCLKFQGDKRNSFFFNIFWAWRRKIYNLEKNEIIYDDMLTKTKVKSFNLFLIIKESLLTKSREELLKLLSPISRTTPLISSGKLLVFDKYPKCNYKWFLHSTLRRGDNLSERLIFSSKKLTNNNNSYNMNVYSFLFIFF